MLSPFLEIVKVCCLHSSYSHVAAAKSNECSTSPCSKSGMGREIVRLKFLAPFVEFFNVLRLVEFL